MHTRPTSSAVPFRAVGHSQVCVLLILGLGFVLIFGYQSEIQGVLLGGNKSVEANRKISKHANVHRRPNTTETVKSLPGNGLVDVQNSNLTRTKQHSDLNRTSLEAKNGRPPPVNRKKKSWKYRKVEAYEPLGDSIHTNSISSEFKLVIKVLSLNNYSPLVRCLSSLSKAEYAGDSVDVHIYIDHFEINDSPESRRRLLLESVRNATEISNKKLGGVRGRTDGIQVSKESNQSKVTPRKAIDLDSRKPDYSPDARVPDRIVTAGDAVKRSDWSRVEEKLMDSLKVLKYIESFEWKHGNKVIHYRTRAGGSQSQWVDAWWPSSDDEFALFVEDDAELSPLYYRYVRSLIATYYYQGNQYDSSLYGISLQRQQIVPGKHGKVLEIDNRTRLFKYQMVGIWGQIFFPKPWKEFRLWYDSKKSHNRKPTVEGMLTSVWYKQYGEKLFTPWFVKFAYSRGYFNLYTNFLRDRVLSVTHRLQGGKSKKYAGCDSVLIWNNGTLDIDLWHMAASQAIKKYDYCFKEVKVGRFASKSSDFAWVLDSTHKNKQIVMISTLGVPEVLVRNFLCTVRNLGMENYLLVGDDRLLLKDLARRGHAAIQIESNANLDENIEKEVHAIFNVLARGYDVWFSRADTIWVGNPLALANTDKADVVGLENPQLNLAFIRSSHETILSLGFLKQELSDLPANVSRLANWDRAREKFLKKYQNDKKVKVQKLRHVTLFNMEKQFESPKLETRGVIAETQVLVLSALKSSSGNDIIKSIRRLKLWNLDDDLACAKLAC